MTTTESTTGRRERKKQEVRSRILEAAADLIGRQGLSDTTIDQIARAVDVSQTTVFNYFASKHDLVQALVADALSTLEDVVDEERRSGASASDAIRRLFQVSAELKTRQRRLMRDLVVEIMRIPDDDADGSGSLRRMRGMYEQILSDGQAAGEVRADLDAEFLAELVTGLYTAVVTTWTSRRNYPIAERLARTADVAVELVAP